jgi:pilus assembly protein Flp/PilA
MKSLMMAIRHFVREEEGAHGVEYALIAGLVGIGFVVGASALGGALNGFLQGVSTCVTTPNLANCSAPFAAPAPPAP